MNYQDAWNWLRSNKQAPFSTVIYVSTIAIAVKLKNVIIDSKHQVMVEVYDEEHQIPHTSHFLPRICLVEVKRFEQFVSDVLSKVVTP